MDKFLTYREAVIKAMTLLAEDSRTIFIGQTVGYPGSIIYETVKHVPQSKRIELPVFEDTQMGMAIGLSLQGFIPVSIYPRIDFLLLAINQLSNHLDMLQELTNREFKAKVIIRTMVGSTKPLYPGIQHCRDHTEVFRALLKNIPVVKLTEVSEVIPAYIRALEREESTVLIEEADRYNA